MIAAIEPAAFGTRVLDRPGDWPGWPLCARSCRCDADDSAPDLAGPLPAELANTVRPRRIQYLAGRLCAARALDDAGCVDSGWIAMGPDRLPCWPHEWTGSISHSDRRAIAVVAPRSACRGVGVDIERIGHCGEAPPIDSVGTSAEWALLAAAPPILAFTLLFSAKEALYKALYPLCRRFQDFDAAELIAVRGASLRLHLTRRWGEGFSSGAVFAVSTLCRDGHVHACVRIDA